jgi:hypothetical protein
MRVAGALAVHTHLRVVDSSELRILAHVVNRLFHVDAIEGPSSSVLALKRVSYFFTGGTSMRIILTQLLAH